MDEYLRPDEFTLPQAARRVGRSVRTIKRWCAAGMPARTVHGRTVVRARDLAEYAERARRVKPARATPDWLK